MPTIPQFPQFFVYVLARPNAAPFYVGKGSGDRVSDHEVEARNGHECYKCRVIRKIWKQCGEVQRYIVFTTDDEAEAYAYEAELIALYGITTLANISTGGKGGATGIKRSAETRAKMSAANKKRMADPEFRTRQIAKMKATMSTPEYRAQLSARAKEQCVNPEYRKQLSTRMKNQMADPEFRARASARMKARQLDPEFQARRIAGIKKAARIHKKAQSDEGAV